MAISTLSKITVPLASDSSASTQGMLMPKLQYRFRVMLENFGVSTPTTELTKQVMDVTRPSVTFEEVEIPVYNSRAYLAGRHTFEPITLNLREDVNNSVQKLVGEPYDPSLLMAFSFEVKGGITKSYKSKFLRGNWPHLVLHCGAFAMLDNLVTHRNQIG